MSSGSGAPGDRPAHRFVYMRDPQPIANILNYHAHIYYDATSSRDRAELLRREIGERFLVRIGAWHDAPVGPHPVSMFQVAFDVQVFETFVPWLMLNRRDLTVLVHPNTDNPRDDHLIHGLWLGDPLPLDATDLPVSLYAVGERIPPVEPNTAPPFRPA